jgi:photosystem II stability/assembly factor-like uncharacterized protein
MNDNHELKERMKRLVGPVDQQGVWRVIEARAASGEAEAEREEAQSVRASQVKSRKVRLAVYAVLALIVAAGVTVGTVLGLDANGQGVYGVDNGNGGYWDKLSLTQQGGKNVYPLEMDPRDSSILYACSQDGLYKTGDGAATWKQILSFGSGSYYVSLDPESSSTVYVVWSSWTSSLLPGAKQTEKLMRSDDGGNSWTELTQNLVDAVRRDYNEPAWKLTSLLFGSSADGSAIYVAAPPKSKNQYPYPFWRSTDHGVTWVLADEAERDRMLSAQHPYPSFLDEWHEYLLDAEGHVVGWPTSGVVDPNDPSLIYAGTGTGVFKSTDKGKTWTDTSAGMTREVGGDFVIDPGSPSVLYVAGADGIFKSGDAGATWRRILDAGFEKGDLEASGNSICTLVIAPSAPSTLYAWTSDGLSRSNDRGETWSKRDGTSLLDAATYDAGRGLTLVASDDAETVFAQAGSNLFRSTDGGDSWTIVLREIASYSTGAALMADPNDPSTMYATTVAFATTAGEENRYAAVKSVDKGATWKTIIGSDKAEGYFELVMDTNDPVAIYMRRSLSLPSTSQSPGGGTTEGNADIEDQKTVLSRSLDGGITWEQLDSTGLPGPILRLVCDPRSKDAWYAFTMRTADRHREVYRSTDGGVTWARVFETLPLGCDKLAFSSAQDGALYLYGGFTGVYRWVPAEK